MFQDNGLKRVNFFDGQLLTAADLRAEQAYFLGRGRRHNRLAHGWGVLQGLGVNVAGDTVEVRPGAAIDCAGNEIHLPACVALAIPPDARRLVVLIRYVERAVDPLPVLGTDIAADESSVQFSRIEEGCEVELSSNAVADPHPALKPGSPGCGLPHPLVIALLRRSRSGWRKALLARRRA